MAGGIAREIEAHESKAWAACVEAAAAAEGNPLDASVDALMVMDDSARVVWISPSTEQMLGRTLADLRGSNALDLVHPDDLGQALCGKRRCSWRVGHWWALMRGNATWSAASPRVQPL